MVYSAVVWLLLKKQQDRIENSKILAQLTTSIKLYYRDSITSCQVFLSLFWSFHMLKHLWCPRIYQLYTMWNVCHLKPVKPTEHHSKPCQTKMNTSCFCSTCYYIEAISKMLCWINSNWCNSWSLYHCLMCSWIEDLLVTVWWYVLGSILD